MAVLDPNEIFFTAFEPKQPNRFIMYMDGFPSFIVKGVSAVTLTQGSVPLNHINVQRFVKGKTVWNPITFTLFDPITPSGAQAVMEWVRLHSESVTGRQGYAAGYKKDVELEMLDPTGVVVQKWVLQGTQLNDADFGSLDYSSSDLADITCTLRFDRAINVF